MFGRISADRSGMFDWNQKFRVGIDSIDAQHQQLFAIGRELYDAMASGQGKAAMGRILDRLVQYTKTHFEHEEGLMRQHGYPDYIKHKKIHADLTAGVLKFQSEFKSGEVGMTIDLLEFLRTWLERHIEHEDAAYTPYLRPKVA